LTAMNDLPWKVLCGERPVGEAEGYEFLSVKPFPRGER
jgi:hypothetical protein